jgi:hypothetical protein
MKLTKNITVGQFPILVIINSVIMQTYGMGKKLRILCRLLKCCFVMHCGKVHNCYYRMTTI